MTVEADLRTLLVGDTAVAALVVDKVSADRVEQGATRPFIVYTRTETDRQKTLDGTVVGVLVTLSLECWGDNRVQAAAVAEAAEAALELAHHTVANRDSGHDPDLDLMQAQLTVQWWEV